VFDRLKKLISSRSEAHSDGPEFAPGDEQVAEAALMFHVIAADGIVTDVERKLLSDRVSAHFGLTVAQTKQLVTAARDADAQAIDLYHFTSRLKRDLDYDRRLALITSLWEMVYADGVVHELEDNIVWRVAELLDVSSRDRMELKKRVREMRGAAADEAD